MKQTIMIFAGLLLAGLVSAQTPARLAARSHGAPIFSQKNAPKSDINYMLTGYHTDDDFEVCTFVYNELQKMSVQHTLYSDGIEATDSIFYNNLGQLVKVCTWQLLNGSSWQNVNYVEYTYDENGRIHTRSNYNRIGGNMEPQGIYTYTYDADGNLIHQDQAWLSDPSFPFTQINYTYTDGLLTTETWNPIGYDASAREVMRYYYTDGRLTLKTDSAYTYDYDLSQNAWSNKGKDTWSYDAAGNCTEHHAYNGSNAEVERSIYVYDTRLLSETAMPWNPEIERPLTYSNVNTYSVEQYYTVDAEQRLQYVGDYIYDYEDFAANQDPDPIHSVLTADALEFSTFPNPANFQVSITSNQQGTLQIFDVAGRQVATQPLSAGSNQISVSNLPNGIYMFRLTTASGCKMIKQVIER